VLTFAVAKILIAGEDTELQASLVDLVSGLGHDACPERRGTASVTLRGHPFDLLLTDDLALLRSGTAVPTLVVSPQATVRDAVQAMRLGALDYLGAPFAHQELALAISAALAPRPGDEGRYGALIGSAPAMRRVFGLIDKLSRADTPVLVLGEEGTGKELVAREIHKRSARRDKPFVAFNCAAITETLLERELFGYAEAAFEGAGRAYTGKLEGADGGTVFLDEIAEVSLSTQVRFLELLRDKRVHPEGKDAVAVDVRIVAATHRNLRAMVEAGEFREDFYYQLSVVSIETPPLRDRREDIPALADAVLTRLADSTGLRGALSPEVAPLFQAYPWPGNVRELENVIEHALLLADRGPDGNRKITAANLPPGLVSGAGPERAETGLVAQIERIEREILRKALEQADWNQSQTARALQLKRSSLQYKMKKYGLSGPSQGPPAASQKPGSG
jgi:DNA-binding NtrC family response regulator